MHDTDSQLAGFLARRLSRLLPREFKKEFKRHLSQNISSREAEADESVRVLVFQGADPGYFISHADLTRIHELQPGSGVDSLQKDRKDSRPVCRQRRSMGDSADPEMIAA